MKKNFGPGARLVPFEAHAILARGPHVFQLGPRAEFAYSTMHSSAARGPASVFVGLAV